MKIKKIYPFLPDVAAVMLSLYAMLRSTYLSSGCFSVFAAGIVIACFMLITVFKLCGIGRSLWGTAAAAVISVGNMTALPMLYYTDGYTQGEISDTAYGTLICLMLMFGSMVISQILMYFLNKLSVGKPKTVPITAAICTLLTAAVIFVFSDRASGTTLVFGMQAAIPAAAVLLLCAAAAVSADKLLRVICSAALAALAGTLVVRNETGIPAVMIAALLIWYLFFSKRRNAVLTVFSVVIPAFGAVGILLLKFFGSRLSGIAIVDKVMTRLFSGNVEQAASAERSLRQSGVFGINSYLYLSEGTSDFCMVTLIHYLGIAFLMLIILSAVPFICISAFELMRERGTLANTLASMSLCLLTVILVYNLLMCVGFAPIIGVQAPFVGISKLFSILSGCLLGWSCFSESDANKLREKCKEIRGEFL
ncbi:MAG: hypothetical protein K6C68_05060 [Ruminococcus sp.]|nr:hypothetical protein [Ruminococcus sp.]